MKKFNWRGFTTFIMFWSFIVLAVSGFVLYIAPSGRVANWSRWTLLGLDKEQWEAIHIIWGLVFIIATVFHMKFNWAIFKSYFRNIGRQIGGIRWQELAASVLLTVLIVWGAAAGWPVFAHIVDYGENFKNYWEESSPIIQLRPENMTLEELAEHFGVTPQAINSYLTHELNLPPMNTGETLEDYKHRLEDEGVISEEEFGLWDIYYALAGHFESAGSEEREYARGGWGRYTVSEIAQMEGVSVDTALSRLKASGIDATADTTIRTIMDSYGLTAEDVIAIIKGER